jgi:uncharacterized membrane-anchored protein YitT (DUF2179 family)
MANPIVKPVRQPKSRLGRLLKEYTLITLGTLIMALGTYFFKFPNNFSTGGVTGLAVVLAKFFPAISRAEFVMVINVALLGLAFLVFGRSFGGKTVYVSLLMSGVTWVLERTVPIAAPMTTQPLLELLFAVALNMGVTGVAIAMVLDWVVKSVLIATRYKSKKWQRFKLI